MDAWPPPSVPTVHPFGATLARLARLAPDAGAVTRPSAESGWVVVADLWAEPGRFARLAGGIAAMLGTDRAEISGQWLLHSHAWRLGCTVAGAYLLDRRIPDLDPGAVALRWHGAAVTGLALGSPRFACRTDDPGAGHRDAVGVADDAALLAVAHDRLAEHFAGLAPAWRALTRRGPRALWHSVVDGVAEAFLQVGARLGTPGAAAAVEAIMAGPPPLAGPIRYLGGGRVQRTRVRNVCCQWFAVNADGALCATCPLPQPPMRS